MEFAEAIGRPRVDGVVMTRGPARRLLRRAGSFAITGHHVIYSVAHTPADGDDGGAAAAAKRTSARADDDDELWIVLHKRIDRVEVKPNASDAAAPAQGTGGGGGAKLELYLKDLMKCIFEVASYQDALAVANSVNILSNLTDLHLHAPFSHRNTEPLAGADGWLLHSADEYFAEVDAAAGGKFRLSEANKDYALCETYPERVIVPSGASDEWLKKSASFRANGRFPVLAYYHAKTKSSILVTSQPLVGVNGKRCKEDESLLNSLIGAAHKGFVVDTRSHSAANAAKNKGGGLEQEMYYSRWKRLHCAVPKWVTLKEAYSKIVEACNDYGTDKFYGRLASSNWLQCVYDALQCATAIALRVETPPDPVDDTTPGPEYQANEVPVLVHGADGFDSTLLAASLAALVLHADSRTIDGFERLVERVWLSLGHPFSVRLAHGPYASGQITGPYEAPTFVLFLDCVWQMQQQYAWSFEFNEHFLIALFGHCNASEYGTFIGNSDKDRKRLQVRTATVSLWSHLNAAAKRRDFANAYYERNESPVWPSPAPHSILLWERLFLRWQRNWHEYDEMVSRFYEWKRDETGLVQQACAS